MGTGAQTCSCDASQSHCTCECKIVPADESGALHLRLGYGTRRGLTSDGDITIERAVLVYIGGLHGLLACLIESRPMVFFLVPREFLLASFSQQNVLLGLKD